MKTQKYILFFALALTAGCATIQKKPGFNQVQEEVADRSGYQIEWNQDTKEDQAVAEKIDSLLTEELDAAAAVQISLLNNQRLKKIYQDLGIAQADVVQAGLLRNPVFSGGVSFPFNGGAPDLLLGASFNFLDFFYIPLRKSVSKSLFEAAKIRVSGAVIEHAASTKMAFYKVQADKQNLELQEQIVQALDGSYTAARALYDAGNTIELNYINEQSLLERARIDLKTAQIQLVKSKETLNRLMGLPSERIGWTVSSRLPEIEQIRYESEFIEKLAIDSSLDLAALGKEIEAMGAVIGLTKREALFPQLELGAEAEREEGKWELGPEASVFIPIFDQGQARNAKVRAQLKKKQYEYVALMVDIQSRARELIRTLEGTKEIVEQYESTLLPLQARVTEQTQAQFNAMQVSVFQLLQAKQMEIQAGRSYIQMLYMFWAINTDLELLVQGRNSLLSNAIDLNNSMMTEVQNEGVH